jgi:flagellar basal body-associated protein FliL
MKLDSNTTLLVIATLIVAAGAYWYFFMGTGNEPPLTATTVTNNQAQTQFETLVGKLQPISFNTAIFSDPRFMVLVDLATPITPEPSGRLDPFAALK